MRAEEFYSFLRAREQIRLNKEAGLPWPWTEDTILQTYKFTNVKREHDRTSRELFALYRENSMASPEVQLLNCAIARYFGTYEFVLALGWQNDFQPEHLISFARERLHRKERVFTGAYVITNNGIKAPKEEVVVGVFLTELWKHRNQICAAAYSRHLWKMMVEELRTVRGFGGTGFMAKEVALDTMQTSFWRQGYHSQLKHGGHIEPLDAKTWSPCGPGARRGLNRLHGRPLKKTMKEDAALWEMRSLHAMRLVLWPKDWVELTVTDIQFQLCEWDKYQRVSLGEGRPRSKYRRPE